VASIGIETVPEQVRRTVTSEAVLDAALTLFAVRGYHGTAVSQVAEMLGIRTPSLYNHMRSKRELLETIIERTLDGVEADFEEAVRDVSDPRERLRRATRIYALRQATHRREALVVNRDTLSLEEPALSILQARRRSQEHALRAVIVEGIRSGVFTVESPDLASFAIREMCVSIARWFRADGALSAEQVADEYSAFALQIVGASRG